MKKYENVYIIDYQDLEIELLDFKGIRIFDLLGYDSIKNDTIYNTYPYEIKKYDITTDLSQMILISAFANWLTCFRGKTWKDDLYYFSDFLEQCGIEEYLDENYEQTLLRLLCTVDEIPEGNYFIRISW